MNENKKKEKIFITGGLGFIGSYLTKLFLEQGDEVFIYDFLKSYVSPLEEDLFYDYLKIRYKDIGSRATVIEGDIRDAHRLSHSIATVKPDKVVHLAALPIADLSDDYPDEAVGVNFLGALNLLNATKDVSSIKKIVTISSSMIYGDFKYKPCDELHLTEPKGIYGGSKLGAEIMTRVHTNRSGIPHIIIRPSAVYGPTDCNRRVTQLFIEKAIAKEPLILHDGGEAELDFTYVEDIAQGIFLATKNDKVLNETFNITRGEGRSLKELATIVKKYFPNTEIRSETISEMKRRPKRGALDISKAKKLLGYDPKFSLEQGMEKYINFIKNLRFEKNHKYEKRD